MCWQETRFLSREKQVMEIENAVESYILIQPKSTLTFTELCNVLGRLPIYFLLFHSYSSQSANLLLSRLANQLFVLSVSCLISSVVCV